MSSIICSTKGGESPVIINVRIAVFILDGNPLNGVSILGEDGKNIPLINCASSVEDQKQQSDQSN